MGLRECVVGEVGQWRAPPQRQRLPQRLRAAPRLSAACALDESVEAVEIELSRLDMDAVSGRFRLQDVRTSVFRRCETKFWREVCAVRGGCSSHSASMRRSVETTRPASRRSSASTARCFRPPSSNGPVSSETSSGPRIRKSGIRPSRVGDRLATPHSISMAGGEAEAIGERTERRSGKSLTPSSWPGSGR